jgi:NADH dehydrogenase [ubiquinone] 1 alpha subcomplex assembly factor 1
MQGAEQPSRAPLTLFAFHTPETIKKDYAVGCDADVGGTSTVHLDFDDDDPARLPPPPPPPPSLGGPFPTNTDTADKDKGNTRGAARFHGHMRLGVRPGYEQRIRGGYAGFRNKVGSPVSSRLVSSP